MAAEGQLKVVAGRITAAAEEGPVMALDVSERGGARRRLRAHHVINRTGPATDVRAQPSPIITDGLFAIGPLTRPEFWETTAVPEILAQGRALAERLSAADTTRGYGI